MQTAFFKTKPKNVSLSPSTVFFLMDAGMLATQCKREAGRNNHGHAWPEPGALRCRHCLIQLHGAPAGFPLATRGRMLQRQWAKGLIDKVDAFHEAYLELGPICC